MNKAYKFRIYPDKEQEILFAKTFGCVRLVYNYYLDKRIQQYQMDQSTLNYTWCANDMAKLKKTEEYSFQRSGQHRTAAVCLSFGCSFPELFKRSKSGFPKFKSKKNSRKSYSTNCINGNIAIKNGCIKLPKVGLVKINQHRSIPSDYKLKSVTISQSPSGKYYASVLFEYDKQVQEQTPQSFIGLDYSMHELYKDSNGNEPKYPGYYRQAEKKLKREQRKLSHMVKGSNN